MIRAATCSAFALAFLLAGCGGGDGDDKTRAANGTASVQFSAPEGDGNSQTLALSVPGFSAKLAVPGLSFGTDESSIDGLRFHPGTKITGMQVAGDAGDGTGGESRGTVQMQFTDPAAPEALLAYYRDAARGSGWREVPPAAGQQFAATKPGDKGEARLALQLGPQGSGSAGHFIVTGQ
ncbi:hypothetical protein [Sphingomonas morindae]|uniref:Secreted protein n=1 Tax=Sphingomonas morindae TaxID=1541170 RepID=A0ABY4X687_9SPHN|nr:hypothetical protein [Sphingomonas morindae]USI72393.1 hypothetical protein LHA26_13995 [Sphingomonas morindae]